MTTSLLLLQKQNNMQRANQHIRPDSAITELSGVGPKIAKLFADMHIQYIRDLLWYLPAQYEDRTLCINIATITTPGIYTVRGRITHSRARKTRGYKTIIEALVTDDTGNIPCTWFNQPYVIQKIPVDAKVCISGKVSLSRMGILTFTQATVEALDKELYGGKLLPVYALHGTLKQHTVRALMRQALSTLSQLTDDIPSDIQLKHRLMPLQEALHAVHAPKSHTLLEQAQQRIALSRLVEWVSIIKKTQRADKQGRAAACVLPIEELKIFLRTLPFTLTTDQKKALWEILQNISTNSPMMRMLCGEVGSGKTIVAALASLAVIRSGHQVVCMAPTSILAQQHYHSFSTVLTQAEYTVVLHTQDHPATPEQLQTADLIVGTHALLSDHIQFRSVGLLIIDEQHRFGVMQRMQLRLQIGRVPHFLSLSATPIPRSFALAIFGTLDISTITTLPAERKPIITRFIKNTQRDAMYTFLMQRIAAKEAVFIVCPLIDTSDTLSVASVTQMFNIVEPKLPQARIGILHGKMKKKEQEEMITAFRNHTIHVLITTTVVEVGVDIPHASIIVIEDADRFGLATLHQLRGRVGRSSLQSFCIVTTQRTDEKTIQRLRFFAEHLSGFELARYDIAHRGAGNILGTTQSGTSEIMTLALRYPKLLTLAHTIVKSAQSHSTLTSSSLHLE